MTKEEIKRICQIYDNLRRERDAATIAYNFDDIFYEHVLATYNLSQPSLLQEQSEVKEIDLKQEFYDFLDVLTGKDNGHLSEDELFRIAEYFFELGLNTRK